MKKILFLCLTFVIAGLPLGCASKPQTAGNEKKDNDDDYVYYTPTGSNIPHKVRKSQVKPTEQQTEQAQQALNDLQKGSSKVPKDN